MCVLDDRINLCSPHADLLRSGWQVYTTGSPNCHFRSIDHLNGCRSEFHTQQNPPTSVFQIRPFLSYDQNLAADKHLQSCLRLPPVCCSCLHFTSEKRGNGPCLDISENVSAFVWQTCWMRIMRHYRRRSVQEGFWVVCSDLFCQASPDGLTQFGRTLAVTKIDFTKGKYIYIFACLWSLLHWHMKKLFYTFRVMWAWARFTC